MPSKKKNHSVRQPASTHWEFDPDIPTDDFFHRRNRSAQEQIADRLWAGRNRETTPCEN